MRILITPYATAGHLRAPLALARALHARGHEVEFFSANDASSAIERAVPGAPRTSLFPPARHGENLDRLAKRWSDPVWLERWAELNLVGTLRQQVDAVEALLRARGHDVVLSDPYVLCGAVAATRTGIPWGAVHTNFSLFAPPELTSVLGSASLAQARDEALAALGVTLSFRGALTLSPAANVVFLDPAVAPPRAPADPPVLLAGFLPTEPPEEIAFDWSRLDGRPLVYATGGWLNSLPAPVVDALVYATGTLGAQLLLTGQREPQRFAGAAHVIPVQFAPQQALLSRVSVLVTHGGANSVMEGFVAGRPMIVCPVSADQPFNATLVEQAGVGRYYRGETERPMRALLEALCAADAPERVHAEALARTLDTTRSLGRAADAIEALRDRAA